MTRPALYLDLTDLVQWVRRNPTVTGIQRVHINYAVHALDLGVSCIMFHGRGCREVELLSAEFVRYVADVLAGRRMMDKRRFYALCPNARLDPWADYRHKYGSKPLKYAWHTLGSAVQFYARQALFKRIAAPVQFQAGDMLINVGRSWTIAGYVTRIQQLKDKYGIAALLFLHDLIPIRNAAERRANSQFLDFVTAALRTFDHFFTSSDYNRGEIARCMQEFLGHEKPVEKLSFGQDLDDRSQPDAPLPEGLEPGRYLLCVGRIAPSKNQLRLLHVWQRIVEAGQQHGVKMVFLGELSANYREFHQAYRAAPGLAQALILLSNASDATLNTLYRHCLFTVFPSTLEGYGLPAAESMAYGKFCLASNATAIPEAAGPYADYFDPLDDAEMSAQIVRYLADPNALQAREALIRSAPLKTWAQASGALVARANQLAGGDQPAG
ncbi:glycosyltransferase [Roseateles koreensis]|uniref:Glycosyltransferase n=1 Tax=Roseateles koreensis TaxID=2987526 RepID=A0ABT5KX08_9BURK|nr:glycosyltransferase [Roseateles koreensis]MDC8786955.1 glycosyltransferase [Roseateles koreensis]